MKIHNHNLITFAFGIAVIAWFILMFWWFFPYKIIKHNDPYGVVPKENHQGGVLMYEMDYCKYTDVMPTVSRQFVDGIIYVVTASGIGLKKGCGKVTVEIPIPKNLPVGTYHLKTILTYQVNPIRTITSEYVTENFTVIK